MTDPKIMSVDEAEEALEISAEFGAFTAYKKDRRRILEAVRAGGKRDGYLIAVKMGDDIDSMRRKHGDDWLNVLIARCDE